MLKKILMLAAIVVAGGISYSIVTSAPTSKSTIVAESISPAAIEPDQPKLVVSNKKVTKLVVEHDQVLNFDVEVSGASVELSIMALEAMTKKYDDVYILINSPGGAVFAGHKLIAYIEASNKRIHTVCVGLCASMAAHIHQSGKSREVFDNAMLMFHPASGGARGQVENMQSMLSTVRLLVDRLDAKIAYRSKYDYADFKSRVSFEYWVLSDEAISKHLADERVFITTNDPKEPFGTPMSSVLPGFLDSKKNKAPEQDFYF